MLLSVTFITGRGLPMSVVVMSMGAYDEDEHERRERKNNTVDVSEDDDRTTYHGSVEYDSGDSAEALLDKFEEIQSGK